MNKTIASELERIKDASDIIKKKSSELGLLKDDGNKVVKTEKIEDHAEAINNIVAKPADTYVASTSDQTIEAGKYLTGTQTIKGVTLEADGSNIVKGNHVSIKSDDQTVTMVEGTLVINHYYTGNGIPSDSLGIDNDFYLVVG